MGAALGAGLGLLFGAATGYERNRMQQKHQADQAYLDLVTKNPTVFANDPAALADLKKRTSPEYAGLLEKIGQHAQQAMQQEAQLGQGSASSQMISGGAPATGGVKPASMTAPGGPTPAPSDPLTSLQQWVSDADNFMRSPYWNSLPEDHRKHIQMLYENKLKQLEELQKEQRAPGLEAEKTKARLGAEFSPEATAAKASSEATVSAAKAKAEEPIRISTAAGEASARLGVETSPKAIEGAAAKAAATESARRKAAGEAPLTPQEKQKLTSDAVLNRSRALAQAKTILSKPNRLFPGVTVPSGAVLDRMAGSILIREGLNPDTAFPLREGDSVTDPVSGKKVIWHESR